MPETSLQRILIVRPTALGDVARTVPALVSLKSAFPAAQIDWLVNRPFADVIASHPCLHSVVPFDRSRPAAAWSLMRSLRRGRYDAVYDLQGLARSGLFTAATGARRRIGFANAREGAWLAYNRRHAVEPTLHAVDRMLALLEADGVPRIDDMRLCVSADAQRWAEQQLAGGRCIAFAPTAQWGSKCWPIERYAQVAQRVLERDASRRMVLLAGPGEAEQARIQPMRELLGERLLVPRTSVAQLMAIIERSDLLVCNDSAALHIAVGLGTPTVSLFGPTDPALVGPFGFDRPESLHVVLRPGDAPKLATDYRHHRDDNTVISKITVEQAWDAIDRKLDH